MRSVRASVNAPLTWPKISLSKVPSGRPPAFTATSGMRDARRGGMQQLGHDLLAGAMLAGDEHVGVGGSDLRDQFEHRLHGGRAGHKLRHAFGAQQAVFHLQLARAAQRLVQLGVHANQADEPLVFPRLLDEVASAALDAFDGEVDVAPGGHHDHRQARIDLLNARQQIEAFLARSGVARVIQVDEQDVVVALPQRFEQQVAASARTPPACLAAASSSSTASRMWG